MITQIEIDGFKTFKDFKVELAPFQVIVGPNGSGKSNLFDALRLLSRLAETDLRSAFQELRGDAHELFTRLPNGKSVDRMRMAVELLVDRKVKDSLGREVELEYRRLRYEIEITLLSGQLHITHESLKPISQVGDNWCKKYNLYQKSWVPEPIGIRDPFIDTARSPSHKAVPENALPVVVNPTLSTMRLYADGRGEAASFRADKTPRTILSGVSNIEYPHVFAAREEIRSWKFLHLNPEVLREPSSTASPQFLSSNGGNLASTLVRIKEEEKFALTDVSRDMANLVPGILKIRVEEDTLSDKYVIYAETSDQRAFSSQVLSDGTLRLLALVTLRNDPKFHSVLCLEEPENGVHPLHLERMTYVLREMATDFNDQEQIDEPLRQVLITTHSPLFISQIAVLDSLLLALVSTRIQDKNTPSFYVTRMVPVVAPSFQTDVERDKAIEYYTIDMIKKYLEGETLNQASNHLKELRTTLHER